MGLPIELPPCDPAALAQVVEAIPQVRHDDQPYIAAAGFGEACRGPTATSAAAWARAMTGTRPLLEARATLDDDAAWTRACPAGRGALATAMRLPPAEGRAALLTTCDLTSHGWFTAEEWTRADGAPLLALLVGVTLEGSDAARPLVRALLGLGPPGPPEPELTPFLSVEILPAPPPAVDETAPSPDGGAIGGVIGGPWLPTTPPSLAVQAGRAPVPCTVRVAVDASGHGRAIAWPDCPAAARDTVARAVLASTFTPAHAEGHAVEGVLDLAWP